MPDLGWPTSVQVDLRNFEIHSPPVVLREFAGIHGERHGFTTQSGTVNGVRTFANTNEQDAFRHAFVHGLKALELFKHEKYLNSIPLAEVSKTDVQLFDTVTGTALWWGFANEYFSATPLPQHLMDLWNNGKGVELARSFLIENKWNMETLSNEKFAKFVADKIKHQANLFIFDRDDVRTKDPALYNTDYLPDDALLTGNVTASHRLISLINREGFTPDLMEKLHKLFPQKFSAPGLLNVLWRGAQNRTGQRGDGETAASGGKPDAQETGGSDLLGATPSETPVPEFSPGNGGAFTSPPGNPTAPDRFEPGHSEPRRTNPGEQTDPTVGLGPEDDDDFYRMAEEVFSSLTIDDWAVIHDDNDPFDNRDPFADGVKWVPGLGPLPANP